MSAMTAQDVDDAIVVLDESYAHDPQSRWIGAYTQLTALQTELHEHMRPYWRVTWCILIASYPPVLAMPLILLLPEALFASWTQPTIWALFSVGAALSTIAYPATVRVAARKHPLVLKMDRIRYALSRFHQAASAQSELHA